MKLFISICFFALIILNAHLGFSQKEIEISGKRYLLVEVKKGETAFGLSQQYKVSQAELKEANPDMTAVLKSGSTIRIPLNKKGTNIQPAATIAKSKAVEPEFYYHKVYKKQTIFSIAKQYGITANELIKYNPEISNGLVEGTILKVPVKKIETYDSPVQAKSVSESVKKDLSNTKPEPDFTTHTVTAGETLYSLSQKYGITLAELIRMNPSLENGLQIGDRLKIQQQKLQQVTEKEQLVSSFENYKVEKGETLFSLAARFGIEVGELKKANPSLFSRSLETGEIILIPKSSDSAQAVKAVQENPNLKFTDNSVGIESGDCQPISGHNHQKYKVALLLPFYLSGNETINASNSNESSLLKSIDFSNQANTVGTDTVAVASTVIIDQRAEGFIEFYEGAVMAIDSLRQNGMNVELCVFDASNEKMINALLQLDVFRDLDLIIGPVYPELQKNVASFAAKNRIPMVSPLASTGNFEENNPYFFKVNPTKEFQIEQTAQYIAREFKDKNFLMVSLAGTSNSTDSKMAELGKEKLLTARNSISSMNHLFHDYDFQKQGLSAVKPLLDESEENVFMIPSDNEAQVSVVVTNLNALAENYNIVLMGSSNLPKLKSIQTENYHHVRLRYLSPTFVDYKKPLVKRFIAKYRDTFSGEPSQFSHQGFDVAYYFLSALNRYGKDFRNCLPQYPMELTQMNFNFAKVGSMGGFMNKNLFVTAYERNFDILNYGALVPASK